MTGGDRPARGGAPGPAAAGPRPAPSASARPARGGLFSPFRCFEAVPAAVLRCLRPRAFSSRRAGAGIALLLLALAAALPSPVARRPPGAAIASTPRRAAAGFLVLVAAALAFTGGPARAAETDIWTATLTIGTGTRTFAGVTTTLYGYRVALVGTSWGSVSPGSFTHNDNTIAVVALQYSPDATDDSLAFDIFRRMGTGTGVLGDGNYKLYVGSTSFSINDPGDFNTFELPDHGLDWSMSVGDEVAVKLVQVTNTDATGAPVILGSARAGSTVTASTAGIRDANGLTNVSYEYQWIRDDSGTETDISGATSSTYELAAADAGKQVKVKVSFTDDDGYDEELTSAAFPRSGTVAAALPPMMGPGELLSATLTAKSFITGDVGCGTGSGNTGCGNSAVLDDNDFDIGTTTYTITALFERNGTITLSFTGGLSDADEGTHSLEVTEGGTTSTLKFSDGTTSSSAKYEWSGTGQSWSADDSVTVKVVSDPPDTTPPELDLVPGRPNKLGLERRISLFFDEDLWTTRAG